MAQAIKIKKNLNVSSILELFLFKRPFVYAVEIAFQLKSRSQAFGKEKTINYCS
jgi:hypothetical protein